MTTDESVGWVVVTFNQASHQPDLEQALYADRAAAEEAAADGRDRTASVFRRERYAVAQVVLCEDPR